MKYHDRMKNFFLENEFKIIYLKNQLNIVNYESIGHLDSYKIIV